MESTTEPHLTNYLLEICGYSGIELQMTEVLPDGDWRTVLHGVENAYVISEFPATGKLFLYVSKIGEEPFEAFSGFAWDTDAWDRLVEIVLCFEGELE